MSMSKIKAIFQPFSTFPKSQDACEGGAIPLRSALQLNFSIYTWMLVGASIHAIAVFILPARRHLLLASFGLLLLKLLNAFLQAHNIFSNPYLEGVVSGRTTALMPEQTGEFSLTPNRKIAIFHLGAKSNHSYGIMAPQFRKLAGYLSKMNAAMDSGEVRGFLGQTTFSRLDSRGAPEFILISYWSSVEDLWAFAHSEIHKVGWQWWEKEIKDNGYVGINHEIFEAEAEHWETIYANFQPTLMGATTHLVRNGKIEGGRVDEKWVSPLVDARRGPLARSSGRMGRPITVHDEAKGERPTYL